eukprot:4609986-Amphidinium_carterae.1
MWLKHDLLKVNAPASWANLAELISEVGILDEQSSVCQLQHWRRIAYLTDAYIEHVLNNRTSTDHVSDGSIPLPMLRGQVLAMIRMAKDAVMALKRPSAPAVTVAESAKECTVKLNTADEKLELVADDLVPAAYKRYKTVFGMFPGDNIDITIEQLTGVH